MEKYTKDQRIVMTLDAGGTSFRFSAIQGGVEIVTPITLPSESSKLESCLNNLQQGFRAVLGSLPSPPVAISFAFPGPADYAAGIIGDLPNFPSFKGGVALGPFLEKAFGIPVFINNDGSLFAYGEALAGVLPEINQRLKAAGSLKQYQNLLGITLGTGFGGGVVVGGRLLLGDNASGGSIWCFPNAKYPGYIAEESVSIRAVKRVYAALSGDTSDWSPKDILDIAEGRKAGDKEAAIASFSELGEAAGDSVATALTLIDGILVIGGGLSGASKYIVPSILKVLNGSLKMMSGRVFSRMQMKVFNLDDDIDFEHFAKGAPVKIKVPGSAKEIDYDPEKRIGLAVSRRGTSASITMGAYVYALNQL